MYTLRRIDGKNIESNTLLGNEYVYVNKDINKSEYLRICEAFGYGDECFGFVLSNGKTIPLYTRSRYFVMIGGKTMSTLK